MSTNIFEQASRQKLRFETKQGSVSTEELWDLNLNSLDTVAKGVNALLKAESEESFITPKRNTASTTLTLKLDILKHVIGVKMEEQEKVKKAAENKQRASFLKEVLQKKELDQLEAKSVEEIKAELALLEG